MEKRILVGTETLLLLASCILYSTIIFDSHPCVPRIPKQTLLRASTDHAPIEIIGNDMLDAFPEKTGTGLADNPYIIESLDINNGSFSYGIDIQNTSKWLVIQNCSINGAASYGMYLENCQHISIMNCSTCHNSVGILLAANTEFIDISSVNASCNTEFGIFAGEPPLNNTYFTISGCTVQANSNYGLIVQGNSNTVSSNFISSNSGIGLQISGSNDTISNNNVTNNGSGIFFSGGTSEFSSNHVWKNLASGFYIFGNKDDFFTKNNVSENGIDGFHLFETLYMNIENNIINNNNGSGIYFEQSNDSEIHGNIIRGNRLGAFIEANSTGNRKFSNDCDDCNNIYPENGLGVLVLTVIIVVAIPMVIAFAYYKSWKRLQQRRAIK